MLIAVFSDSHGDVAPMRQAILTHGPDMVLHLGDHARDALALEGVLPGLDLRCVRGNCDLGSAAPDRLCFQAEGLRIFMTHGHIYSVKYSVDTLCYAAQEQGAQLALFGHTHQSEYTTRGGVTLLNPGSTGMGERSFALLHIRGGTFTCRMEKL